MKTNAEQVILKNFREATRHLLPEGISYMEEENKYLGGVMVSEFACLADYVNFHPRFNILGESEEIRFEVRKNSISVGWGGNNIIEFDGDRYAKINAEKIRFVASIYQRKEEWMKAILSIDVSPIRKEKEEQRAAAEKAKKEREDRLMEVYEKANIHVGTEIQRPNYRILFKVVRISKSKIQLDDNKFYTKLEVAQKLEAREWQVKQ